MRHDLIAAGMGMLLLSLGACAANSASTNRVAPSRQAAQALDDSQYYAPSEPAVQPAQPAAPAATEDLQAQPVAYRAPDAAHAPAAVEQVAVEKAPGPAGRPLVPAFPAKVEQARLRDMKTVFFQFDQADLTPEAKRELQANAAWLKAHSSVRVRIEGHCDERGTNEYNLALGSRRANQVRDYLVQQGVPTAMLESVSYGEEMPLKSGHDESAWKWNRRVQFSPAESPRPTAARIPAGGEPRL